MLNASYLFVILCYFILSLNNILTQACNSTIFLEEDDLRALTLKDVLSDKFPLRRFNGIWTSATEFVYINNQGLVEFNVETKTEKILLEQQILEKWRVSSITPSRTKTKLLIKYDEKPLRLNQLLARYVVYDTVTNDEYYLADGEEIANCVWSTRNDNIAYVYKFNVYYVNFEQDFKTAVAVKVSDETQPDIIQGIGDWVYYDQIFQKVNGLWFSPRGWYLAYVWLNTTEVMDYTYVEYGEPDNFDNSYPKLVTFKYPKAGTKIPQARLRVTHIVAPRPTETFRAPPELGDEPILVSLGWIDFDNMAPMWMNRAQTKAIVQSCLLDSVLDCETLVEFSEPNGWIEPDTLICSQYQTSRKRCWIKGSIQGWRSLIEIDVATKVSYAITPKGFTIIELYGINESREEIFVLATGDVKTTNGPAQRHLYKITKTKEFQCISCNILSPEGNNCTYASAIFSKDLSHFSVSCQGPDPTFVSIYTNGDTVTELLSWEKNTATREKLQRYQKTKTMTLQVPLTANGDQFALVKLFLPPCFNPQSTKKYPMTVVTYTDTKSVHTVEIFTNGFSDYLAQSRGVISCYIDARGSDFKGNDILFAIKNKVGTVEVDDYLAVVKYLIKNYKFIDSQRVGIWGRGFGGYSAAMTLAKDEENIFQGGLSLSPITSFFAHTAIFTDRLMGTPSENREAYIASDLLHYANKMFGKKYLLIHGTADDKVHYQHSMLWARALEKAGVIFDQQTYPDGTFNTILEHQFKIMDAFWIKTLRITLWDALCEK